MFTTYDWPRLKEAHNTSDEALSSQSLLGDLGNRTSNLLNYLLRDSDWTDCPVVTLLSSVCPRTKSRPWWWTRDQLDASPDLQWRQISMPWTACEQAKRKLCGRGAFHSDLSTMCWWACDKQQPAFSILRVLSCDRNQRSFKSLPHLLVGLNVFK